MGAAGDMPGPRPLRPMHSPRSGSEISGRVTGSPQRRQPGAPLDVIVVRKLGVPFRPELGMGAAGEDGVRVINPEIVDLAGVSENVLAAVQAREQAEVGTRAGWYRPARPREPLDGRTAVVAGDGIATRSEEHTSEL